MNAVTQHLKSRYTVTEVIVMHDVRKKGGELPGAMERSGRVENYIFILHLMSLINASQ